MISEINLPNRPFSWIDVCAPEDEDFSRLAGEFGLPYLLVQDTLKPEHLPKYEETDDGHFLMMRSFDKESDDEASTIQDLTRKIAFFVTPERLITIHRVKLDVINKVADRCPKSEHPKTIQSLLHMLVLEVIRSYEAPIDRLEDIHDNFETDVLSRECQLKKSRVYHFRRQLFLIKRLLKQTNDTVYRFREFWDGHESMVQDLRENLDQLYFRLDDLSDNFEHLFQLEISLNDQRANEVMRILTVFSSILLPLNFIASFYGMNFTHLPGLDSPHALLGISLAMFLVSAAAILYFRSRGWFRFRKDL